MVRNAKIPEDHSVCQNFVKDFSDHSKTILKWLYRSELIGLKGARKKTHIVPLGALSSIDGNNRGALLIHIIHVLWGFLLYLLTTYRVWGKVMFSQLSQGTCSLPAPGQLGKGPIPSPGQLGKEPTLPLPLAREVGDPLSQHSPHCQVGRGPASCPQKDQAGRMS